MAPRIAEDSTLVSNNWTASSGMKEELRPAQPSGQEGTAIPIILRPWLFFYRSIPKIYVPCTNVDVSFTIASAIFLSGCRLVYRQVFYAQGWPVGAKETFDAATALTSITHSSLLLPGLGALLTTQPYVPSARMDSAPQWWQNSATALISFCTGYMIYDSVMSYLVEKWVPGVGPVMNTEDWMFLGHHAATTLYMTSSRLMGAGHMSAMILMFTGEFTNPVHNAYNISLLAITLECCSGPFAQLFHRYIEYTFALLYCIFRIFVGPICAAHLTWDLVFTKSGRKNVHLPLSILWLPMCWGVLFGSIPWIMECIKILRLGLNVQGYDEL